jgi:hypothetical protein
MLDVILLIIGIVLSLVALAWVVKVAYQARDSRPVRVELSMANDEIPAEEIELTPYVEFVSRQFSKHFSDV